MPSIRPLAVVAIVATLARAGAAVKPALCDYGELTVQVSDVAEPAFACQRTTDYTFLPPTALPTTREVKNICTKCRDLVEAVRRAKFPLCVLPLDDGSTVTIEKLFVDVVEQCSSSNSDSTSPSDSSSLTKKPATPSSTTSDSDDSSQASSKPTAGDSLDGSDDPSTSNSDSDSGEDDESTSGSIEDVPSIEPEVQPSPTTATPAPSTALRPVTFGVNACILAVALMLSAL